MILQTYPYPTPDGIIELVRKTEFDRLKWELDERCTELAKWQTLAGQLAEAIRAIHKPLGDETETSGNPCVGPKPSQGRALAAALAAYESAKSGSLSDPLAEAVKRMEAVPWAVLDKAWSENAFEGSGGIEGVRARLIQAAKGEQP